MHVLLAVWYNWDCKLNPLPWDLQRAPPGRPRPTFAGGYTLVCHRPLRSCGTGGKGKNVSCSSIFRHFVESPNQSVHPLSQPVFLVGPNSKPLPLCAQYKQRV